jgi:hypothetical protein
VWHKASVAQREAWGLPIAAGAQSYSHDALFRRIKEGSTHLYHSKAFQVLEERSASGDTTTQYVWGIEYVDSMVERDRDTDANGTLDERLYAMHARPKRRHLLLGPQLIGRRRPSTGALHRPLAQLRQCRPIRLRPGAEFSVAPSPGGVR